MPQKSLPNLGLSPAPIQTPVLQSSLARPAPGLPTVGGPAEGSGLSTVWNKFHHDVYQQLCQDKVIRTLLLSDLTIANPCGNVITVQQQGWGNRIVGTLTQTIAADLVVTFTKGADVMTITIPAATPINTPVVQSITGIQFQDKEVIVPAITASDGSTASIPIAALSVEWNAVQSQSVSGT